MKILIALKDDYHTQRNNLIDPTDTCNVTSMINALKASGIRIPVTEGQPEDTLAKILGSKEAKDKLAKEFPSMASMPPREVHAMLSWAVNEKLVGAKVTTFASSVSLQEILFRIAKHRAASVVSTTMTRRGHLVAVVGFSSTQSIDEIKNPATVALKQVRRIYLLDSWGDWSACYEAGSSGFCVGISTQEFMAMAKPVAAERKWAHLFSAEGVF